MLRLKGDAGGVQAGVDALAGRFFKQIRDKFHLQQRFASGDSDAAVGIKVAGRLKLAQNLFRRHFRAAAGLPGIRVVAVEAAHGAAF